MLVAKSDAPDFAAKLKASRTVRYVLEDGPIPRPLPAGGASIAPIAAASSDPAGAAYLWAQWNLEKTKTVGAWQVTKGHPNVKVAVLDSGYCAHHVDTENKIDVENSKSFWNERAGCAVAFQGARPAWCPASLAAQTLQRGRVTGASGSITLTRTTGTGSDAGSLLRAVQGDPATSDAQRFRQRGASIRTNADLRPHRKGRQKDATGRESSTHGWLATAPPCDTARPHRCGHELPPPP